MFQLYRLSGYLLYMPAMSLVCSICIKIRVRTQTPSCQLVPPAEAPAASPLLSQLATGEDRAMD